MIKTKQIAVITGDLVDSSSFSNDRMLAIISRLKNEFTTLKTTESAGKAYFSLYRGDSFQGIVEETENALVIALKLKALINSYVDKNTDTGNKTPLADVRISIGIGEATYDIDAINVSNGPAFQLSGRSLDTMKANNLMMSLTTGDPEIDDEFRVHMKFLDGITHRWSIASAEVVYFLLNDYKELQIANELNRSQAAINLRKKAAGWDEIKLLMQRYEHVIKKFKK